MNRRSFIKSAAVVSTAIPLIVNGISAVEEQPSYTFLRIVTPGHINGHHIWVIRSNDSRNPVVPTHRNYLPDFPPTEAKAILAYDGFGKLRVGDYYRYHKDIYSEWQKVTSVKDYGPHWASPHNTWHGIETERVFPYNSNEPYHKSLYDSLKEPKPAHQLKYE